MVLYKTFLLSWLMFLSSVNWNDVLKNRIKHSTMLFHLDFPSCVFVLLLFLQVPETHIFLDKQAWITQCSVSTEQSVRVILWGVFPKSAGPVLEKVIFPLGACVAAVCRGEVGCLTWLVGLLLSTSWSTVNQIRDQVMWLCVWASQLFN